MRAHAKFSPQKSSRSTPSFVRRVPSIRDVMRQRALLSNATPPVVKVTRLLARRPSRFA